MDAVVKGLIIYFFLVLLFAVSGKRSLAQIDTFSFVLLLIISEAAQNALVGHDYSITYAVILILTLAACDIFFGRLKARVPQIEHALRGSSLIIVENGKPLEDRIKKAGVDDDEILASARELRGIERMEQIKYAILETSGQITIIPKDDFRTDLGVSRKGV